MTVIPLANTLTRASAKSALTAAGWPFYLHDMMVAIGAAESTLRIGVIGPKNLNGTEDLGWLQINSRYVPQFDRARLLSDPVYNASCALLIFKTQGLKAWAAYSTGRHLPFMPPHEGGPNLAVGAAAWFLVVELQEKINASGVITPSLVVDGSYGRKTLAGVAAWQVRNEPQKDGVLRAADSVRLIP